MMIYSTAQVEEESCLSKYSGHAMLNRYGVLSKLLPAELLADETGRFFCFCFVIKDRLELA